jgi:Family of unknown function (DUF6328)
VDIGKVVEERTGEDRNERRARELAELLQEVRVMLPGVQVFFAFLLTVPFSARFGAVMPLQEADFFGTLVCTALSAGLLLTPSVHHGSCGGSRPGNIACEGESSRNRGHGTARGGDGRGDVRDHRHPVRLCRRRHSDRCGQRLLPRRVVLDADPIPTELNLAAPKANRKR